MCGIIGLVSNDLGAKDVETSLSAALKDISHRGPDDSGYELDKINNVNVALGHTRLAIIDLSPGGHQPKLSPCGRYKIVFNGEVYNYIELREELEAKGVEFTTQSDTEVLLNAWIMWGEDCLTRLEGMFAFAVYDNEEQSLTVVRDAFGIKPLYYILDNEKRFAFSSELPALMSLCDETAYELNLQASFDFLVNGFYQHNEETFVKGVHQLLPAHMFKLDLKSMKMTQPKKWWAPSINEKKLTFDEAVSKVRTNFLNSVAKHMRSDVPIGVALSGGIDSSAVVCSIRHLYPDIDINTFSYIAGTKKINEESWVDIVNEHTQSKAHKVYESDCNIFKELSDLISKQGEPFSTTSIYAQYKVFELARNNGVKVTLDGQGADELTGGYWGFPGCVLHSKLINFDLKNAYKFLISSSKLSGRSIWSTMYQILQSMCSVKTVSSLKSLYGKSYRPSWLNVSLFDKSNVYFGETEGVLANNPSSKRILMAKLLNSVTGKGLPGLLRHADRNSMAFSIESRVPFLTINQAEFFYSLPEEYLVSNEGVTKYIFREAMSGIVPDAILDRQDKVGFATSERDLLFKARAEIESALSELEIPPVFNKPELDKLMKEFFDNPGSVESGQIWRIFNFIVWWNRFLK